MKRFVTIAAVCIGVISGLVVVHAMVDLEFDREVPVAAPPDATWDVLRLSFRDSSNSPVWPRDLETIEAAELATGANVLATYHMPVLGDVPQSYRLTEYDDGRRTLRYETDASHPLAGGATVSVVPDGEHSRVEWRGAYDIGLTPRSQISAVFTRYFLGVFFEELRGGFERWSETRPTWAGE